MFNDKSSIFSSGNKLFFEIEAVSNKGDNPGWRDKKKQIQQTKKRGIACFVEKATLGNTSEIINLNTVVLYFHKLRVLIMEIDKSCFGGARKKEKRMGKYMRSL